MIDYMNIDCTEQEFLWVPVHVGIEGNKEADKTAKYIIY